MQIEGRCYFCGKPGHKSPDCRTKEKITKDEWVINKAQHHVHSKNDGNKSMSRSSLSSKKEDPVIGCSGLHCSFAQAINTKELILLDIDSTDTVFCNPKCVSNIQDLDNKLSINKNGGLMKSHHKCDITYINDVWYNKKYFTNIISMNDMTEKFCVTMSLKE